MALKWIRKRCFRKVCKKSEWSIEQQTHEDLAMKYMKITLNVQRLQNSWIMERQIHFLLAFTGKLIVRLQQLHCRPTATSMGQLPFAQSCTQTCLAGPYA
jgi:hypothetical protein